jgi:hypothetical protein
MSKIWMGMLKPSFSGTTYFRPINMMSDVPDGLSNTLLAAEKAGGSKGHGVECNLGQGLLARL